MPRRKNYECTIKEGLDAIELEKYRVVVPCLKTQIECYIQQIELLKRINEQKTVALLERDNDRKKHIESQNTTIKILIEANNELRAENRQLKTKLGNIDD